jgi:4-azaleucine resistance transporter AzlC
MQRLWQDPARRAEFERGMRDMAPFFPGIVAWGLVTGVTMVKSGLTVPMALLMALLAYAGTAQLASLPLLAAAAPTWVIALAALATNMRFVIYAAAMRGWLTDYSRRRLSVLGFLSGDFSFVLFMDRVAKEGAFPHRDAWLFGTNALNWAFWQAGSIAGIVGGAYIPTNWGLEFAGTLAMLALVVPACRTLAGATGALSAGAVALAARGWPYRSGLLAAIIVGVVTAMVVEQVRNGLTAVERA